MAPAAQPPAGIWSQSEQLALQPFSPLLGQQLDVQGDSPGRWNHQPSAPACSWSQAEGNQGAGVGAGEAAGRLWPLTQPLGELRPGMKPCLTTLSRHLQAAVLGAPCALGDEPRVPVCAEPLGTGGVAEPQVADKPRHQLHRQPWAPGLANPWAHDLGHPQATAIPTQTVDPRLRRVTVGTWAGRTPSSSPRGRQHHERRAPCRAGPRAWFVGAACCRAVGGCLLQGCPGPPGTGYAGQAWEDGCREGMDLAASGGGVSSPWRLPLSCQSPWEDGGLGILAVIQPPGANTPGAGRPLLALGRGS